MQQGVNHRPQHGRDAFGHECDCSSDRAHPELLSLITPVTADGIALCKA